MPNFLKSLFKPSSSPRNPRGFRNTEGDNQRYEIQVRPSSASSFTAGALSTGRSTSSHADMRGHHGDNQRSDQVQRLLETLEARGHDSDERNNEMLKKLLRALKEMEGKDEGVKEGSIHKREDDRGERRSTLDIHQQSDGGRSSKYYKGKGKNRAENDTLNDTSRRKDRLLDPVIRGCSGAIGSGERLINSFVGQGPNSHLVGKVMALLEAQRDELGEHAPYTGRRRYPALVTLEQIYEKIEIGLEDIASMGETESRDSLMTLIQVLQEGPDYLIDIILILSIIHHASVISIPFSVEIRDVLNRAIDDQSDLHTFRRAAESIIGIASALDRNLLEDKECLEAYKIIGVLVKQLQVRVASSALPTPMPSIPPTPSGLSTPSLATPTPLTLPSTPKSSSPPSPSTLSISSASTISGPSSPVYKAMTTSELQSVYGTGVSTPTPATSKPLPGLSSYNASTTTSKTATPASSSKAATPAESSEDSDDDSDEEVWEYRGQLLTRSALDLVLRQETLAQADSSGQWAGEVSWDDLRKAWIPHYVQKLKVSDLADGEVPDTTPAGFKTKEKDAWGNKIGFYGPNMEMYYKQEPKWELPDK
ncbi:hypothetical protein IAT40_007455 [Kwoniella sp. CBS 6097]